MKILLFDIVRTSLEEVWPSVEHSLGLMYLSAAVKQQLGALVDVRVRTLISKPKLSAQESATVLRHLEEWQPDVVGIRSLSIGKDSLYAAVRTVREWCHDCFVLVGGPHATDQPEDVLRNADVDCVVIGEGEHTFCELMERRLRRTTIEDVDGIALRRNGKIVTTTPRTLIADLDALPLPDYSVIDLDQFNNRYQTFTAKIYQRHGNLLTTRGCPYRCMYCHNVLGKRFRARSPESVVSEIRYLHDTFGLTDFQIIDDIFNLDLARAKEICDGIVASGMRLTLSFPNGVRGDRMDEELLDKMAAAGTKFMSYAIETGSPRLQKLIHKNLNLAKADAAISYSASLGIVTRGFFMLGFPTESEAEVLQTIEFARQSALCGATFFTVVYFPGTELYRLARSLGYFENGYEVKRDYVQVSEGPYDFSVERLHELKLRGIREFAFTRERIRNALDLLPGYFTQREIDGFLMAYVVSSRLQLDEVEDPEVRRLLQRYFVVADRFSKRAEFYV
jgi:anaerobic magnesium-protoporphyrin IX monomethyl ester cyclase